MAHFSEDEGKDLLAMFETMGAKPAGNSPEEMRHWWKEYLKSQETPPDPKAEEWFENQERKVVKDQAAVSLAVAASAAQQVRLPTFSGEDEPGKGETTFELWKYDVECLVQEEVHNVDTIRQAIRRSLKGRAAAILQRMGTNPPIQKILSKLSGIYGLVDAGQTTLAEFYAAKQKPTETVASWSVRLEELLDRAMKLRAVDEGQVDEMLRSRLWAGLQPRLRDAARNKYDSIYDFDQLRVTNRYIFVLHISKNL